MKTWSVSFPDWKEELRQAALSPQAKAAYSREIITFLRHCKSSRAPASTELAKSYLAWREKQSNGPAREALRWFYREGRIRAGQPGGAVTGGRDTAAESATTEAGFDPEVTRVGLRPMEPPVAAGDLGSSPWEAALIKATRERGFLWRRVNGFANAA